ncbi:MAG: 16S rRNA (guanine(527)-N(7))-methyltransferase RsmG [Victivallales bacterium]|nr:16S rRNA (guanine(527)-N(7))-methyltransferase RsmG [Victivallales bacterium]
MEGFTSLGDFRGRSQKLYSLLSEENSKYNLTRIVSEEDFWIKHVMDSLLLLSYRPGLLEGRHEIADLGCGAGFPSLILAMALPECEFTAIDSVLKKTRFVSFAAESLCLGNLKVLRGRGRELGLQGCWRGRFDMLVARAVGSATEVYREARGLLKPGGEIVMYKTPGAATAEVPGLKAAAGLQCDVGDVYGLPGGAGSRCFISCRI